MTEPGWTRCAECGMPCKADEYHPYAACLMFKQYHDSAVCAKRARQRSIQIRMGNCGPFYRD